MQITMIWIQLLVWVHLAFAQDPMVGVIRGTVVSTDQYPIPNAHILVKGSGLPGGVQRATDSQGRFRIENVPSGPYSVQVTGVGYRDETRKVRLSDGDIVDLQIALEPVQNLQDRTVVSASRKAEKILDAPAAVVVVEGREIKDRANRTVVEHLKYATGMDFLQTGLVQTNVVARGFNNIFSGALLSFVDHRISRLPSLRFNAHHFIPLVPDDIDRIEVVLGPGSALYGPNSASGVMHVITRSPFESVGTTLTSGVGERGLRHVALRHAKRLNDRIAFRISGGYYAARDWEYEEPGEILQRDFQIERKGLTLRLDLKPADETDIVFSAGHSESDNLDVTPLGTGQVRGWMYNFLQGRLQHRNLFMQAFHARSDAGQTRLLRSGNPVIDRSTLTVLQLQHAAALGERQRFTYGFDALMTRPKTGGTISGIYEDRDGINVFGGYLQSETSLTSSLDMVLAGRYDAHNHIEEPVFSPRAALVFKPAAEHTARLTFNRAFGTPTSTNLFLDIQWVPDPFGSGIDLRAQGTFQGFTFKQGADQRPMFRSPFASAAGLAVEDYIEMDDPVFTNVMWQAGRGAVMKEFMPTLTQLATGVVPQEQIGDLVTEFQDLVPQQVAGLRNTMRVLDVDNGTFNPVEEISEVPRLKANITQTFELGYKGAIGNKLMITADVYRNQKTDFVSQLQAETPNVFLDPLSLHQALVDTFEHKFASGTGITAVLYGLDAPLRGGNGNGTAADELAELFVSGTGQNGAASIPFGTVSPEQAADPTAVVLTYRNLGDVTVYGLDLSFAYFADDAWTFRGTYSHLSENVFPIRMLNAPIDKLNLGVQYAHSGSGLHLDGWARYRGGFEMASGTYAGLVEPYTVFDLNVAYNLPVQASAGSATLSVNISNIFDRKHREFIGAPEIGRMISGGLTVRF